MKRIIAIVLCFICLFALYFKLTNTGYEWTPRKYITYVLNNVEPFPRAVIDLKIDENADGIDYLVSFFGWTFSLVGCFFESVRVVFHNIGVIFYGLLPFEIIEFGGNGGSGIGGGGGGGR